MCDGILGDSMKDIFTNQNNFSGAHCSTVDELIEVLQWYSDEGYGDLPIRKLNKPIGCKSERIDEVFRLDPSMGNQPSHPDDEDIHCITLY